jgi:hypothetical protein
MRGRKPFKCSTCSKPFTTHKGASDHIAGVHAKKGGEVITEDRHEADDDPSFADLYIENELNRAMGLPTEDWIDDMRWD